MSGRHAAASFGCAGGVLKTTGPAWSWDFTPKSAKISALIVDGTQRKLVRRKDVDELVDHIRGTVLTHLSGMGARCSRDMVVQPQHRRGGALGPHRIGSGLRKDGGCAWRAAA